MPNMRLYAFWAEWSIAMLLTLSFALALMSHFTLLLYTMERHFSLFSYAVHVNMYHFQK